MKLTHFRFDAKYLQINKINKKENQTNPINSVKNSIIADKFVIPNCTLLQAYNNMLSFKGDTPTLSLQNKHKSNFGRFNDNKAWDYFKNTLCTNYTEKEIDDLLNAISSKNSEDKEACKKFLSLININSVENITYSDKIQDEKTKKAKTITLPRALTPIEAKELIVNGLTKNSDIERYFKLADDDGFESDIAIASIKYSLDSKDRIRLEWLSNELFENNRKLSQEEAIICIAYGFNETEQVQSFINRLEKEYRGNKLDLFEAALCTIHNLDDSRTEQFFELKSKQIPYPKEDGEEDTYTLSTQEAVLCAKAELDEDELKRYAELKNKPFMYTAVREHNSPKAPSTELIIAYIKDKQSDEEIAELAKYGLKSAQEYQDLQDIMQIFGYKTSDEIDKYEKKHLVYISKLRDEDGKNIFKDRNGNFCFEGFDMDVLRVISFSQLTPHQVQDFKEVLSILKTLPNHSKHNINNIAGKLVRLQGEDDKDKFNISSLDMDALHIISFFKLNPSQIKDFKEILSILKNLPNNQKKDIYDLAGCISRQQDENGRNRYKNKENKFDFNGFDVSDICKMLSFKLNLQQVEEVREIIPALRILSDSKEYDITDIACHLALCSEEVKNRFRKEDNKFNFDGLKLEDIRRIAQFDLTQTQEEDFKELLPILKITPKNQTNHVEEMLCYIVKIQDKKGKNIFKDETSNFDFYQFDKDVLVSLLRYKVTALQIKDFLELISILKTMPNPQKIDIYQLAYDISQQQDENGKNKYRNEENKFDFSDLDVSALAKIIFFNVPLAQIQDFKEILSVLKQISYDGKNDINDVACVIATFPEESKAIFKDENGKFYSGGFDANIIEKIAYHKLTQSEANDFNKILPIIEQTWQRDTRLDINDIALEIAKLPEDKKETYKDEQNNFNFEGFDNLDLAGIAEFELTKEKALDLRNILAALKERKDISSENLSFYLKDMVMLPTEIKTTLKDKQGNFNFDNFDFSTVRILYDYTQKQTQNYLYLVTTLGIAPENAIYIAQDEELMQRFKLVDPNIFWQGATGESKEVFELFNSLLDSNDIMGNRLQEKDFDINLPEDCSFKFGTLRYSPTDSNQQGFNVELQKASKNLKPIMIVKNKNSENESYIAYDGAIALFKELRTLTQDEAGILQEDLSSHSHFSEEEINALSEAARHFIIDILEENGECIISKGIEGITKPFEGKELDTTTTKEKFKEILQKLHNDIYSPNVSIENILRLIPKDSTIQIRPYATSSKSTHEILYSISAEWKDKNGKEWQLRVHSHDLKFLDNGKSWIYRLGYKDATSAEQLFYDNNQNDFIAGSSNPITHIKINEEAETYENKLISNPYFQKTIREISISFNKTQLIDAVAKELSINKDNKSKDEIGTEIIQKCQRNAGYYYKYKKVIDTLLNEQGLPALDKAA